MRHEHDQRCHVIDFHRGYDHYHRCGLDDYDRGRNDDHHSACAPCELGDS